MSPPLFLLLFFGAVHSTAGLMRGKFGPPQNKVDVFFSADKRILKTGLRTAVFSTLQSATTPERLRLHLAVDRVDVDDFRDTFGFSNGQTKRQFPSGAQMELHMLDKEELDRLVPKTGKLPFDNPNNYVRFFIDSYLPADSDRAVWLDADVVVLADITDLADAVMKDPSKTVAFAKYPASGFGFGGAFPIVYMLMNKSWARANLDQKILNHPVWNSGVLAFNMNRMREHRLRDRALHWLQYGRDVGLSRYGGSQMTLDLAALVHPEENEDPFIEVDSTWNCWWSFMGTLRTTRAMLRHKYGFTPRGSMKPLTDLKEVNHCKILHFAGKNKPWNPNASEILKGAALDRWVEAESASQHFFH